MIGKYPFLLSYVVDVDRLHIAPCRNKMVKLQVNIKDKLELPSGFHLLQRWKLGRDLSPVAQLVS